MPPNIATPNMEELAGVDISSNEREAIYLQAVYRLRSRKIPYAG